ncbi:unnamed protein product [Rotaria magnacalcarata]|uniref:ascorbate ferrireductase (transmembrane) n=2 Tax=Rotaria magnacalcarata TaxID=392030 RepID=A0A816ND66_9BILA|nr:unnamed protein product [Rotaria magnacalcarata]CAF1486501.1 unnamed protein product [Rotaria magnacalcarata]CAF2033933.1 unnamed protein product [Rotaria magnacalcarata]CAF2080278.1 unnamed protein product [Rotaria magnacalcarata]CAF2108320.1 unnamed protein product [Rotaria magnacalcarata]
MSTVSSTGVLVTLEQAHGSIMIFTWIVFASTGILFARYGRLLHFGEKRKILGADVWFQFHRAILIVAAVTTLTGFILVLAKGDNETVSKNRDKNRLTAHSILGYIIVASVLVQVAMGLFRCGPQSPSRYIFNRIHRAVGIIAFTFSIPAIFLVASVLQNNTTGLMVILALWTGWVVILVIILEIIKHRCQATSAEKTEATQPSKFNTLKLFLFLANFLVALSLAIPLIVILWQQ